ncbi:MAG TPA: ABC transporter permease, partial [Myxococcaceae bacterium]|nr:ABC transporter permease [Myxococcaceae bacterium]
PLSWILWPIRCPIQLALAQDAGSFLRALPGGLAVAGLHYAWVISSHASFEEAAVEAAERRARLLEARRSGQRGTPTRRLGSGKKTPFALAGTGRPEVALLWKNLVAMLRGESHRALLVTLVFGAAIAAILLKQRVELLFSLGCLSMAFFAALLGPDTLRQDLRQDLSHMEILRSFPLSGRQVVLAELLAPGLVLSGVEVVLIIGSLAFSLDKPIPGFPPSVRLAIALGLALLLPALTLLNLLLRNAAVLLFPSWMAVDPHQTRGFEVMGQRLLTFAANLMLMLVAVLPAGITGGLLLLLLWGAVGAVALVLASGLAAGVLLVEVYFGLLLLGELFERFDVSV